jgi:hypothetical protein
VHATGSKDRDSRSGDTADWVACGEGCGGCRNLASLWAMTVAGVWTECFTSWLNADTVNTEGQVHLVMLGYSLHMHAGPPPSVVSEESGRTHHLLLTIRGTVVEQIWGEIRV